MNQADNDAGNRAIDSLINYETVKVLMFNSSKLYFFSKFCYGFLTEDFIKNYKKFLLRFSVF